MDHISDIFLHFLNQTKMLHWQTKSFAQHKTFDKFYGNFGDLVDDFVEVMMGKYGRVKTKGTIRIENYDNVSIPEFIKQLDMFLLHLSEVFSDPSDSDLLNIRDSMMGEVNRLRYLLTLT
jgi:DNA-binding ferritin-like protein